MKIIYFISLFGLSTAVLAADSSNKEISSAHDSNDLKTAYVEMAFTMPAWQFLNYIKDQFNRDGGSVQIDAWPISCGKGIMVSITAPHNRGDLVDFIVKFFQTNYVALPVKYTDDNQQIAYDFMQNNLNNLDSLFVVDKKNKTIYITGFKIACQKISADLKNILNIPDHHN